MEEKVSVERKISIKSDNNVEDDYERFEIHNPLPAIDNLSENDFKVHKSHTSITNSNHKQEIDVGKDVDSSTSSDIEDDDDDDDEGNFKITIVSPTKKTSTSEVNISSDDFVNTQDSSHINIYENINEDSDDEDHKIQDNDDGNFKIHFVQHSKNDKNGNGSKKINFVEPIHNEREEEEIQDEEDEGNFKINVVQHPPSKTVDNFDNSEEDEEDDENFKIQIVQKTNNKKVESEESEEEDKLEKYTSQGYSNQAASIFLDSDDEYEPQVMRPRHFHEDEEDC